MRAADRAHVHHLPVPPEAAHELVGDLNAGWYTRGWQVALYGSLATGCPLAGDIDLVAFAIKLDPEPWGDLVVELRDRDWKMLDMWESLMSHSFAFRLPGPAYLVDLSFRKPDAG